MLKEWDLSLVIMGLVVLGAYHAYFVYVLKTRPLQTVIGNNHVGRRAWVRSMMQDSDKKGVLAVQSLRNTMMGSILWASVAILLCSGSIAFLNTTYTYGVRKPVLESLSSKEDPLVIVSIKLAALLLCFMSCFFCCMQSVRYLNQASFLINTPPEGVLSAIATPDYVANLFERACNFQAAGSRSFYLALPLLLWILGPIPVVMASFVMVPCLYHLDMK